MSRKLWFSGSILCEKTLDENGLSLTPLTREQQDAVIKKCEAYPFLIKLVMEYKDFLYYNAWKCGPRFPTERFAYDRLLEIDRFFEEIGEKVYYGSEPSRKEGK